MKGSSYLLFDLSLRTSLENDFQMFSIMSPGDFLEETQDYIAGGDLINNAYMLRKVLAQADLKYE